eukprot:SAG11_NODE_5968_length_1423_cov_1.223565_2_plen_70_part_01
MPVGAEKIGHERTDESVPLAEKRGGGMEGDLEDGVGCRCGARIIREVQEVKRLPRVLVIHLNRVETHARP